MLHGIDISHWQERTPSLAGLDFVIARATYGTFPDDRYRQHITKGRSRQLLVGAYHFGRNGDVPGQVKAFVKAAGDVDMYVLDLERDKGHKTMTRKEAREWIAGVRIALGGHPVGYYHSESGFSDVGQDWNWVANYSREPKIRYDIWQWQGSPLDKDHFRGTRAQLLKLVSGRNEVGLHVTMPAALVTGRLSIPQGTDAIRVADAEHFKVPKHVKRPAITAQLTGGQTASGWLVDLNGDELHFIRRSEALLFEDTIGTSCDEAVAAERERVKLAAAAAVDDVP